MISNIFLFMISFKQILLTSGVTFLFGMYSFYNIILHVNHLEHAIYETNNIYKHELNELNKKYSELLNKYDELQMEMKFIKGL